MQERRELMDRCEWNLSGGFPIDQCPEDATEDREGEHYCEEHADDWDAEFGD